MSKSKNNVVAMLLILTFVFSMIPMISVAMSSYMAAATNRFLTSTGPIFLEVKRTDIPIVAN